MNQKNAETVYGLIAQGRVALNGVQLFGAALNVAFMEEPLQQALTKAEAAVDRWLAAKGQFKVELEFQRTATDRIKAHVKDSMKDFKMVFGDAWSPRWEVLGFLDDSLELPKRIDAIVELGRRMAVYLAADASRENAARNVTGAYLQGLLTARYEARGKVTAAQTAVAQSMTQRKTAEYELRSILTGLRGLLKGMGPEDERWYAFGLSRPADPSTPETPANLTAQVIAPGTVLLSWDHTLRAERYRVFVKGPGEEAVFEQKGRTANLKFVIEGLTPGTTYEFSVKAANRSGEGAMSDTVAVMA